MDQLNPPHDENLAKALRAKRRKLGFGRLWHQAEARFRRSEFRLTLFAACAGVIAGFCVVIISGIVEFAHHLVFNVNSFTGISGAQHIDPMLTFLGPSIGGLLVGVSIIAHTRWRQRTPVDPIEANALHGGRMSVLDSLVLVGHNILSAGCGASVGLEACYTQIGGGFASKLGQMLNLRRADLRVLVGCGTAAAIAAAFDAPLAGAAYAFELVIGVYTISALAPVAVAAFMGNLVAKLLFHPSFVVAISVQNIAIGDYPLALLLGIVCAMAGIGVMRLVTYIEQVIRHTQLPPLLRPMLGGAVVGSLGQFSPQVLSAGHGALHILSHIQQSWPLLLAIFLFKCLASAVSIGTGFRGGLFFASLFLGGLLGKLYALGLAGVGYAPDEALSLYIIAGMSGFAAAVVGAPLTMIVLALEVTGAINITGVIMLTVLAASLTAREFFGYSFATWRFHLRGESIRSAQDVAWIRSLTVGSLMRRDVPHSPNNQPLRQFRDAFPLGSYRHVLNMDENGSYAGLIDVAHAHAAELDDLADVLLMDDLAEFRNVTLSPELTAREAATTFDRANTDVLAVVHDRKVVGVLSEAYMLRRYAAELEKNRRDAFGEA